MVAKRSKNFRSGDLAEQLGLLILQNLALVAPVPRTEDVGIDAVVTLLEDHNQYNFIATDSFFIQIKSIKEASITYKPDEVKWLFDLELPYFIARVDRDEQSLSLYCCHRLSEAFLGNRDRKESITIDFQTYNSEDDIIKGNTVSVGPSVMEIGLSECLSDEKRTKFIKLCKSHIEEEKYNLQSRKIGYINSLQWESSSPVQRNKILPFKLAPTGGTQRGIDITEYGHPYIASLVSESLKKWNATEIEELIRRLEVVRDIINMPEKESNESGSVVLKRDESGESYSGGDIVLVPAGDKPESFDAKKFFTGNSDDR
ncbi:hypothetical protein KY897_004268 [Vibrio vulnificus]|nr:hypothetical protein [Vibrio vulnificus]